MIYRGPVQTLLLAIGFLLSPAPGAAYFVYPEYTCEHRNHKGECDTVIRIDGHTNRTRYLGRRSECVGLYNPHPLSYFRNPECGIPAGYRFYSNVHRPFVQTSPWNPNRRFWY